MKKDYTIIETIEVTRIFYKEMMPECFEPCKNIPHEYIDLLKTKLMADDVVVANVQILEHSNEEEYKGDEREVSWWFHVDGEHENLWRCKKCGRGIEMIAGKHRYCPNCGRYMMRGVE